MDEAASGQRIAYNGDQRAESPGRLPAAEVQQLRQIAHRVAQTAGRIGDELVQMHRSFALQLGLASHVRDFHDLRDLFGEQQDDTWRQGEASGRHEMSVNHPHDLHTIDSTTDPARLVMAVQDLASKAGDVAARTSATADAATSSLPIRHPRSSDGPSSHAVLEVEFPTQGLSLDRQHHDAREPSSTFEENPQDVVSKQQAVQALELFREIRLRIKLRSSDQDFHSHKRDKELVKGFKVQLANHIRPILLQFAGQLSLEDLQHAGVAFARQCFRVVMQAPRNDRRSLLEHGVATRMFGNLEETLQLYVRDRDSLAIHSTESPSARTLPRRAKHSSSASDKVFDGTRAPSIRNRVADYQSPAHLSVAPSSSSAKIFEGPNQRRYSSNSEGPMLAIKRGRRATGGQSAAASFDHGRIQRRASPGLHPSRRSSKIPISTSKYSCDAASLLRWRELGGGRLGHAQLRDAQVNRSLQANLLSNITPWRHWGHASKDISATEWSPNGRNFAIGASANLDDRNIQYNEKRNLVYGDIETNEIMELPEHRIDRPHPNTIASGDNALPDTYNTMEPYIYTTVSSICFGQERGWMYTSSYDRTVKIWDVTRERPTCSQTLHHAHAVQVMDTSFAFPLLASGQNQTAAPINLYRVTNGTAQALGSMDSSRAKFRTLGPTCLKFGRSAFNSHFLLAGFGENKDEHGQRDREGDICLWDVRTTPPTKIKLTSTARNVHDVVWHPHDTYFAAAIATEFGENASARGKALTYIRTWNPRMSQGRVYEFDCPALDINELRFHPVHDHYISASCTDGATYLWDSRKDDQYIVRLQHGNPLDPTETRLVRVLGAHRAREETDTGVTLAAWDSGGVSLFTGSSDGVIKQWNPWVAEKDALIRDVAHYDSGVMRGSFSPDASHLLVGLVKGSVEILSSAPFPSNCASLESYEDSTELEIEQIKTVHTSDTYGSYGTQFADELLLSGQIVVHPDLGAGKGPMYRGPYAAWARSNASPGELAHTELDPDILADQLHQDQWQRGLLAGGRPTVAAQERQEWLQRRDNDKTVPCAQHLKRTRTHSSTSSLTISGHTPKKGRTSSSSSVEEQSGPSEEESPTRILLTDDPSPSEYESLGNCTVDVALESSIPQGLSTSAASSGNAITPSPPLPVILDQRISNETEGSRIASPYLTPHRPRPSSTWEAAFRTPPPISPIVKASPQMPGSSSSLPGVSPRPKAKFRMPPDIRPGPHSPIGQTKDMSRSQTKESAKQAGARGEVITVD